MTDRRILFGVSLVVFVVLAASACSWAQSSPDDAARSATPTRDSSNSTTDQPIGQAIAKLVRVEESVVSPEKPKLEPVRAIRLALAKRVKWEFTETPLAEVVDVLKKDLDVPIRLDMRALGDLGVTPDTTITFNMTGITAKAALKLLLQDLGLTTMIDDEVLVITSPDAADNHLTTVFYNVADLPAFRRPNGKTAPDYEKLIDVLTQSVKPTSWDEVGGTGSVLEYDAANVQVLVISQTDEAHDEIRNLLDGLRKLHQDPLTEDEIQNLPPEPPKHPRPKPTFPPMGMGMGGMSGGAQPPATPPSSGAPASPAAPQTPGGGGAPAGGPPPHSGAGMF